MRGKSVLAGVVQGVLAFLIGILNLHPSPATCGPKSKLVAEFDIDPNIQWKVSAPHKTLR